MVSSHSQGARERAAIGLGANIGEPLSQIQTAMADLARLPHSRLLACSGLYRSAPVGFAAQPDFINAVALLETALTPRQLIEALLAIEQAHGRQRLAANGPRTLDLDLLLYGDAIIAEPGLTVPHPRMHQRRFVLDPLLEIAPDAVIPGKGGAADCLARILDQQVERLP